VFPIFCQSVGSIGSDASMARPIAWWSAVTGEGRFIWSALISTEESLVAGILATANLIFWDPAGYQQGHRAISFLRGERC